MASDVRLRLYEPADAEFARRVFASTRERELAALPSEHHEWFITTQFDAQTRAYRTYCSDEEFLIVLSDERPVGRLVLHKDPDAWRLVDIAFLPQFRNRGVGTTVMKGVCADADRAGASVRCAVELFNPARLFYERLGFRVTGDDGLQCTMEYRPVI